MKKRLRFVFCFLFFLTACGSKLHLAPGSPLTLASSSENSVTVSLALEMDASGQTWLAATFTPENLDCHLYSKATPLDGVNGLGRPTLVELVQDSKLQAAGPLTESVTAQESDEAAGLYEYPTGPVTLRLPVILPPGAGWVDENISVTYMACGGGACLPPVEGKVIPVRVPGAGSVSEP
jgi:hypothetical protein